MNTHMYSSPVKCNPCNPFQFSGWFSWSIVDILKDVCQGIPLDFSFQWYVDVLLRKSSQGANYWCFALHLDHLCWEIVLPSVEAEASGENRYSQHPKGATVKWHGDMQPSGYDGNRGYVELELLVGTWPQAHTSFKNPVSWSAQL